MATAQSLITRALRLIQVVGSGVTPDSDALSDGLSALNAMLDSWRNQPNAAWTTDEITGNLTPGKQSYTIGPTGADIVTTRPVRIENARILLNGVKYPVDLIDQTQWAAIRVTGLNTNIPNRLYSTGDYPNATLNFWPVPNQACQVVLALLHPLASFSALTDTAAFPPGYEQAISFNLAVVLAPEFGVSPSVEVLKIAANSLADIKRMNYEPLVASTGLAQSRRYNIYSDS